MEAAVLEDGAGYVQESINPRLDLFSEIERLKDERNAVLLAHYYQEPEIQDIADYIGDSLGLSREAADTDADMIVFAGVHFMAESAKIMNPAKKVILPDLNAGCSLADTCPADEFEEWLQQYPDHEVVTYVNSSAAVKALSDVTCTSSSAAHIINQIPDDQPIVFAPDRNLGKYLKRETGRDDMVLWDGVCIVHETFNEQKLVRKQARHPEAEIIAHPECEEVVLDRAAFIGSTSQLRRHVGESESDSFIVATEEGLLHQMRKDNPDKELIPAPPDSGCNCNQCPHMRLNTIEKLYLCLKHEKPEVTLEPGIREQALRPIERMMEMSQSIG
jgi:quinolinate synthase